MKKQVWLWSFLVVLPMALADTFLSGIWDKMLWMGNIGFLGISSASAVVAFTRILIWILVFTIFFALIATFSAGKGQGGALQFLNRRQGGIVAAVIATITAIFLPAEVLLAVGSGWATLVAIILVGLPVFGIFWFLWVFPRPDDRRFTGDTRGSVVIKLIACLILFWVLMAMKYHLVNVLRVV